MPLSQFVEISQQFQSRSLPDVPGATLAELSSRQMGADLPAGARMAIGVGSRGITDLSEIVRATVSYFRDQGLEPFVIPAMGSHGGATADGQRAVLEHYNVTETFIGCPVVSTLEVVSLGSTSDGIETCIDAAAARSDGIFLINRIKWHPSFEGPVESGLMKMCAIGLGKAQGARAYHTHAARCGMLAVVQSVGRHVLASGKVLGGLAIVEDANHAIAGVTALPAVEIEPGEEELLRLARSWMPRIPFEDVDILIIDEIGKEISGTGMDSKVVNRHPHGNVNPWPWAPRIRRIYLRDLSETTSGNANGIGMADLISQRLHDKIDWHATNINGITASNLNVIRTPLRAANDRAALELLAQTVGRMRVDEVTAVRIQNTLKLGRMWVTRNLLDSEPLRCGLQITGSPFELRFDASGNLLEEY